LFRRTVILCISSHLAATATAATFYVDPKGSDTGRGTVSRPLKTLARAAAAMGSGDTCYLRKGVYRETLRPSKSGSEGRPITFVNYRGETAVISGADLLTGGKREENNIYSAPMAWTLKDGDQVFVNGEMTSEARWPNAGGDFLFKPVRASARDGASNRVVHNGLGEQNNAWKGADLWCAGGQSWICWTEKVESYDAKSHTLFFTREYHGPKYFYKPRKGSKFSLRGIRRCLDAPGEWFYDKSAKKMLFIPPKGKSVNSLMIAAKRRQDCIDLSGRSYIRVIGIGFRAGGIRTDEKSSSNTLGQLNGRYVSHSWSRDVGSKNGVLLRGRGHLLVSCDLGYSSAAVVSVQGSDHRIINNNIHHGGYGALWQGTVKLQGRRILFSHNTVRHAGRDLINVHNLMESLVQYNDVSDAGWLTSDLGMIYGHNTDFANTRFCYNLVHDNHAKQHAMGIYFDHLSNNAIVHHNVIWNVRSDPVRINNPSYCNLVFNNSSWRTGNLGTFDHIGRNDMFACRYWGNIFNRKPKFPGHVVIENNMINGNPPYRNPKNGDFRLTDAGSNVGAYAPPAKPWKAGCDLEDPPDPLPVHTPADFPWMNMVANACFEFGTLEGWKKVGARRAGLVKGNGWGVGWGGSKKTRTGTSRWELKLGPGTDGVSQVLSGLSPKTKYTLSAWLKVSGGGSVVLGVSGHGGPDARAESKSAGWERKSVHFTTGAGAKSAKIYVMKATRDAGNAWADNFTLPRAPPK